MNWIKKTITLFFFITSINYLHAMRTEFLEINRRENKNNDQTNNKNNQQEITLRGPNNLKISDAVKSNETNKQQQLQQRKSIERTPIENSENPLRSFDNPVSFRNKISLVPELEKKLIDVQNETSNEQTIQFKEPSIKINETNYFKQNKKIEAPLEEYVEKIDTELKKKYPITKKLPKNLVELYTAAYLIDRSNLFFTTKISPQEINKNTIRTNKDWDVPNPSNLEKFSAGLDALENNSAFYDFEYQNNYFNQKNMLLPMEDYVEVLKQNPIFQNIPPVIIQNYILEVLKETKSGQRGWMWGSNEILAPGQIKEYKPGWPTEVNSNGNLVKSPTPAQKIYAMIEAIDEIKNIISKPPKQTMLSTAYDFAKETHDTAIKTAQEQKNNLYNNLYDKAEQTILTNLFTQEEINKIEQEVNIRQQEKTESQPELIKDYLAKKSEVLPYEKAKPKIKDIFDRNTRSPLTLYLIDNFQEVAKNIVKTKEHLKFFVSSIIQTFSRIKGLSEIETTELQTVGNDEVTNLINDKQSWFNAHASEFNAKFHTWIDQFIAKMYQNIGKTNPKDIQGINFLEETTNPLTPKIDINWNKERNTIASILVTYKDNTLLFDQKNNNIIYDPETNTYEIATDLYPKPKPKSYGQLLSNIASDTLTNAVVVSPLQQAAEGNSSLKNDVTKLEKNIISQPYHSEGFLRLNYKPQEEILETIISKQNTENNHISTTTQKYSTKNKKLLSQTTTISPKTNSQTNELFFGSADTYSPNVTINYNPNNENPVSFSVEYEHPQSKEKFTLNSTPENISFKDGTYTIQARLEPTTPKPTGYTGLIIDLWEKLSTNLSTKLYRSAVSSFKDTWTGSRLRQQFPTSYAAAEKWMLANYETGVDSVIVEFNPTEKIIATRVFSTTAQGQVQGKNAIYLIN